MPHPILEQRKMLFHGKNYLHGIISGINETRAFFIELYKYMSIFIIKFGKTESLDLKQ